MNAISPRTLAVREQPLPEPVIQCPHWRSSARKWRRRRSARRDWRSAPSWSRASASWWKRMTAETVGAATVSILAIVAPLICLAGVIAIVVWAIRRLRQSWAH